MGRKDGYKNYMARKYINYSKYIPVTMCLFKKILKRVYIFTERKKLPIISVKPIRKKMQL